jgi:hypothetical protein
LGAQEDNPTKIRKKYQLYVILQLIFNAVKESYKVY